MKFTIPSYFQNPKNKNTCMEILINKQAEKQGNWVLRSIKLQSQQIRSSFSVQSTHSIKIKTIHQTFLQLE